VIHAVCAVFFARLYATIEGRLPFILPAILMVPLFALIFCQSCLIGLWAAMATPAWWLRVLGCIAGIVYLEILLQVEEDFGFPATISTLTIVIVLSCLRVWGAGLHQLQVDQYQGSGESIRFSIRGLMIFTFSVAVSVGVAKAIREHHGFGLDFFLVATWAICFVVVNLAAIWATMGLWKPLMRSVVVLAMSLALGAIFCYAINQGWDTWCYILAIMFLQSALLIASLLFVRSCRYRIVKTARVASSVDDSIMLQN
jgi:hypothetical protein